MAGINSNFNNLKENYLFAEVANRVAQFAAEHPGADIISLGIGDVTTPLAHNVVAAMKDAAGEMGTPRGFHGYGPYEGYGFLRSAVAAHYSALGALVDPDEVFISDGAKTDLGNILDLFAAGARVLIPDPVYPAYVDANTIAGNQISYLTANEQNSFLPGPPDLAYDIVYLCSPNNPTGAAYNRAQLGQWVEYANRVGAVILFDAAYERFVRSNEIPRSIYEIEGAKTCSIEFFSFSKTAGFTGLRCGFTVVPAALRHGGENLSALWKKRAAIRYNGTSYIVQRAALAALAPDGERECSRLSAQYLNHARVLCDALRTLGIKHFGGTNSPYVWFKTPAGLDSWATFDVLLKNGVVCTPGAGFGANGEGYCRLSSFGETAAVETAAARLKKSLGDSV